MIIYCARNISNDKMYVGKTTKQLEVRKKGHYDSVKNGSETHFHNALRKDEFEWIVLEQLSLTDDIDERERFWIEKLDTYKDGYNMTEGGEGGLTYSKGDELYRRIKHKLGHPGKTNPGASSAVHMKAQNTIRENVISGKYFVSGESHGNFKGKFKEKHANYKGRGPSATAKAVSILGVQYQSLRAAARAHGVSAETVSNRCKKANYIEWKFV